MWRRLAVGQWDQFWNLIPGHSRLNCIDEKLEDIASMLLGSFHHRQDTLDELTARRTVCSQASFTMDHRRSQCTLGGVVRWLHIRNGEELPHGLPVRQHIGTLPVAAVDTALKT